MNMLISAYRAVMSVMDRRLQLLLDADRYSRVAHAATMSGRSVAAVIREAIDVRFPPEEEADRAAAAAELLAMSEAPGGLPGEDAAQLKDEYARHLESKVEGP